MLCRPCQLVRDSKACTFPLSSVLSHFKRSAVMGTDSTAYHIRCTAPPFSGTPGISFHPDGLGHVRDNTLANGGYMSRRVQPTCCEKCDWLCNTNLTWQTSSVKILSVPRRRIRQKHRMQQGLVPLLHSFLSHLENESRKITTKTKNIPPHSKPAEAIFRSFGKSN